MNSLACPCGSNLSYQECCQPFHSRDKYPPTAEQLMRSRYSAFVKADIAYLLHTRHSSTQSLDNPLLLQQSCQDTTWTNLRIQQCLRGQSNDNQGSVTFSAHYIENNKPGVLTETSRFVKEDQQWYYLDGNHCTSHNPPATLPGRNEACWCGSGKKFKRCHG
ncbi:MAG: YchJ family protein [Pseudomonadales bacterium]|nr:YchJ family protein [Pseudomonadales bacterium]